MIGFDTTLIILKKPHYPSHTACTFADIGLILILLKTIFQSFLAFLRPRLNRVQFVMVIAVLTGLAAGLVAVLLKTLVHFIYSVIAGLSLAGAAYLLFPLLGILITAWIIHRYFRAGLERGIAMVLKSIHLRSSYIPLSHTWAHIVTSSVTVGLGGSAGLEAPIVATGSAFGSNIARVSELSQSERTLIIACGASAGIAAVFNAPIAGVIFSVEVLLSETVVSYFIPLILASVTGALCSKIILKEEALFNFVLKQDFDYHNVPFYILLGVMGGFISLYYARVFRLVEGSIHRWHFNIYLKAIFAGIILLLLLLLFPPLFGEGYGSIKAAAEGHWQAYASGRQLIPFFSDNWGLIVFAALLVLFKPVAAAVTIGGGGNGGNFAPSLFAGAHMGFVFSRLMNHSALVKIPESNFSLVGMAGVLSGVMYCPLTAVFLIAEITNGYELFIPLMIVSSLSYFIARSYQPFSMELRKLAAEGVVYSRKKEKNLLASMRLQDIMSDEYETISADRKLGDLVEIIKQSEKNIFAVTGMRGKFIGIIELNDVKQRIFQPELYQRVSVKAIMKRPPAILRPDQEMHTVMEQFDLTQSWYLPVVNKEGIFMGFISKTRLFNKYRELLSGQDDLYE